MDTEEEYRGLPKIPHETPPLKNLDQQNKRAVGNFRTPGHSASKITSDLRTLRPNPLVGAQKNTKLLRHSLELQEPRIAARKYHEHKKYHKTGAQIKEILQGINQYNKQLEDIAEEIAAFEREYDQIKKDMESHQEEVFKHRKKYDELKTSFDSMAGQIEVLKRDASDYKNKRDALKGELAEAQKANAYLEVLRKSLVDLY